MDKTRTLPPLVRGKVTRVLEFFVDKIKFFKNILLLTDNFDLVLQVQWWGESLPALIRPKELQVEDRILKNTQSVEPSYHSEKYVIKTASELFQLYLKTCEVLELSVLEVVENYVIGSAFLRNLINLLNNNNELISMPIFDYLGEEIGEVIIHVNFSEKFHKKLEMKQNENAQLFKYNYLDKKLKKDYDILKNLEDNFLSLGEKTLCYDGHLSQKNYRDNFYEDSESQNNFYDFTKNVRTRNFNLNSVTEINKPLKNQEEAKSSIMRKNSSSESLPNIKVLNDPSKVLDFNLNSQFRSKTNIKNTKIKVPNKFSTESIQFNSKSKFPIGKSGNEKKKVIKATAGFKNISKKHIDLKKDKKFDSKVSLTEKFKNSEVFPGYKQTGVQNLSSKETSNTKVLDYLLGCDMSQDNEEKALNDFKTMSPSCNLVESINQLCLVSDNNSPQSWNRPNPKSVCLKQPHLNFDFNNPIERDYYEKFFLKSTSCTDFEVAEFLNHPENSFKLGKSEPYETELQKNSQSSLKSYRKFSLAEDATKNSVNEENVLCDTNMNDRAKSCGRCKYYKKLSELDTIIDSLKHFEQKMIMYEKNSQITGTLIKTNHLAEGS